VKGCAVVILLLALSLASNATGHSPLKLIKVISLPSIKKGFDHFAIDKERDRLFSSAGNSVDVFDAKTGNHLASLLGLDRPHSILYREDADRIFVVEGTEIAGALRVFDGHSNNHIATVFLAPGANWIVYDPTTQYLSVTHSGDVVQHDYSISSVVDTNKWQKLRDIRSEASVLEDIAIERSTEKMFVGLKMTNEGAVIIRKTQSVTTWPLRLGNLISPLVLDEAHHRLFVGRRSAQLVVFDTTSGKEVQVLPINVAIRDLRLDSVSKRLYANCGGPPQGGRGSVDIFNSWMRTITNSSEASRLVSRQETAYWSIKPRDISLVFPRMVPAMREYCV
jgi:hypothetical protein